jgi:hypothetical protein
MRRYLDRQLTFAKRLRRKMTGAEDILWRSLRGSALAGVKFRRPVPIGTYVVDFLCVEHGWWSSSMGPLTRIPHKGSMMLVAMQSGASGAIASCVSRMISSSAVETSFSIAFARRSRPADARPSLSRALRAGEGGRTKFGRVKGGSGVR